MIDILSRLAWKPSDTSEFHSLDTVAQKALKRAATHGQANRRADKLVSVNGSWLMVPTRKGLVQVAVEDGRAFRL